MLCLCHKHFVEEKSIGNVQTERRKIEKRSNEGDAEKKIWFYGYCIQSCGVWQTIFQSPLDPS